jgi:hypothetical protein
MIFAVYRVDFDEYEAGWGSRPDGYALSSSKYLANSNKTNYESKGDYELYFRGTEPRLIEVSKEVYDLVHRDGTVWDGQLKQMGLKP